MTDQPSFVLEQVDSLVAHPGNPRRGDIDAIVDSIREHGFYGVLIVQRSTRHVLVGNHRLEAARRLGISHVPVEWHDVDDDEALRILLQDNRTTDQAGYDDEALYRELERVAAADGGLAGTGYDTFDIAELRATLGDTPPLSGEERSRPEAHELEAMSRTWFLVAAPLHEHGKVSAVLATLTEIEGVDVASAQD